ncbi:Aste57867_3562 [Aphanomyces stellatus]|uniref:Aste57867_3562 protein n=1 Tax=Aphanomyces stellatus TaxID=120398 RepID=A0A485K9Y8_9STRA|nr:hypothetical protein As57867_003551 [Aphanomyces stellatus]VFT80725.1 Aste57867_3562 [Aphanomyces stellatus]
MPNIGVVHSIVLLFSRPNSLPLVLWEKFVVVAAGLSIILGTFFWVLSAAKALDFANQEDKDIWEEGAQQLSTAGSVALEIFYHPSNVRGLWYLWCFHRLEDPKELVNIQQDFPVFPLATACHRWQFLGILLLNHINSIGQYAAALGMWMYNCKTRPDMLMNVFWILATAPGVLATLWELWIEEKYKRENRTALRVAKFRL